MGAPVGAHGPGIWFSIAASCRRLAVHCNEARAWRLSLWPPHSQTVPVHSSCWFRLGTLSSAAGNPNPPQP